jgi:hypothetical protein
MVFPLLGRGPPFKPFALRAITGLMMAGPTIVLGHNVWRGGLPPVVVTVMGWFFLFRGLLLLPPVAAAGFLLLSRCS